MNSSRSVKELVKKISVEFKDLNLKLTNYTVVDMRATIAIYAGYNLMSKFKNYSDIFALKERWSALFNTHTDNIRVKVFKNKLVVYLHPIVSYVSQKIDGSISWRHRGVRRNSG